MSGRFEVGAGAPRVAVVLPVHDQEAWLPGAVHSLLAQSLVDWECVVVDDGSPGDVRAALGEAADDPRVRLERLPSGAMRDLTLAELGELLDAAKL